MSAASPALPARRESRAAPGRLRRAEELLLMVFAAAISLSIAASEIAFLAALGLRLARAARGEPIPLRPRAAAWTVLGLAAVWCASAAFAPEPVSSLLRVHRLYQALVVFLVCERSGDPGVARRLAMAYFAGAALGGVYGLLTWIEDTLAGDPLARLLGGFSTAMTSGNVLAIALPACVAILVAGASGPRRWAAAAALPVFLALVATRTRSSWLGAVAGAITALALARSRRWAAVGIGALLVVSIAAAGSPSLRQRAASILDSRDYTVQGRVSLWRTGWQLFRERPLLGWGLADQGARIRAHRRPDATFVAGHFHSNPVQIAVTGGALGLAAYSAFLAALAWPAWKRRKSSPWALAALSVWVSFQVAGLFDWSFGDAEVAYQFFFWMGLGAADNCGAEEGADVDPSRASLIA